MLLLLQNGKLRNGRIGALESELETAKQMILLKQSQLVKLTGSKTIHLQRIDELVHLNAQLAAEMAEISEQAKLQAKAQQKILLDKAKLNKEQVTSFKQEIKQLKKKLQRPQYKSLPENRGSEMRVSGSK